MQNPETPVQIVTGHYDDLDLAAFYWDWVFRALLGNEDGEQAFQEMPALFGLLTYQKVWIAHNTEDGH